MLSYFSHECHNLWFIHEQMNRDRRLGVRSDWWLACYFRASSFTKTGARVLPWIACLIRMSSRTFIQPVPYPPLRCAFPSRGRLFIIRAEFSFAIPESEKAMWNNDHLIFAFHLPRGLAALIGVTGKPYPSCLSCHSHPIRPCGAPSPRGEGCDTRIPSSKKRRRSRH